MLQEPLKSRYETLYNKLVPPEGKCATAEGEMLRAASRIGYRYYNDGDKYFEGYGIETAGGARDYLLNISPMKHRLNMLLRKHKTDEKYEGMITELIEAIVSYIEGRETYEENSKDMLDFTPHRSRCSWCSDYIDYCACD